MQALVIAGAWSFPYDAGACGLSLAKGGLMSKKSTRRLSQIIHRFISFKNNHGNNNALQSFQFSKR
jgi:hypothetical protein